MQNARAAGLSASVLRRNTRLFSCCRKVFRQGFRRKNQKLLYGSKEEQIIEVEVGFLLNENGKLVLGIKAPPLFQRAIHNLLDYWK